MSDLFKTECVKFKGCEWEFWGGVVGLSEKLVVFDEESAVGHALDLSQRSREALADGMIELWGRFRRGEIHSDVRAYEKATRTPKVPRTRKAA